MLIEIKMSDGEKMRMDVDGYEWKDGGRRLRIHEHINGYEYNSYFNTDRVTYVGLVNMLYGYGGEDE